MQMTTACSHMEYSAHICLDRVDEFYSAWTQSNLQ